MRRVTLILLITFSLTNLSFGQTIQEIFKSLPLNYTSELTTGAKDSLIEQGTYTIPDGDSDETMKVDYSAEKNYIRLYYYYTTGQRGFIVIELRRFQKTDGSCVVVYSKFGGAERAYDQDSLLTFDYENGTLKQNENLGLPENLETRAFLKDNLPDSLKGEKITLSTSYNLKPKETNCIEYEVDPQSDRFNEWIKTERILFTWNGKRFEKREE